MVVKRAGPYIVSIGRKTTVYRLEAGEIENAYYPKVIRFLHDPYKIVPFLIRISQ